MKEKQSEQTENQRIHLGKSKDEVAAYVPVKKSKKRMILLLYVIYAVIVLASLTLVVEHSGVARWQFSLAYMLRIIRMNLQNLAQLVMYGKTSGGIEFRLIRYLVLGLAGAALAACGALMQGTFRSVLASPSTLGLQAGGTLGNLIYALAFCSGSGTLITYSYGDMEKIAQQSSFWTQNLQQLIVFAGSLGAVVLILGITMAAGRGQVSASTMILAGSIFSSMIGSLCGLIQYYMILKNPSDERITLIRSLSMGSMDRIFSVRQLAAMAVILLPCMLLLLLMSGRMNLLALGEDAARSMGMDVKRYRMLMMLAATLMSAAVAAGVGHIGFIGFMIPLVVRRLTGPDFRKLLPASMAAGAIFLTVVYDVARVLELTDSLNLITSTVGCIVMLFVLWKKRGDVSGAAYIR